MRSLRHLIRENLIAVWTLLALTLALKLIVPVGFMPVLSTNGFEIILCDGMEPAKPMMMAMHGMPADKSHHQAPAKSDSPCPFAALSAPALGGADPIQLAIALIALVAAGRVLTTALPRRNIAHLRPPLRGPPARG